MFKEISWLQFLGFLVVALVLYYLYVGIVYYRLELTALLTNTRSRPPVTVANRGEVPVAAENEFTEEEDDEPDTVTDEPDSSEPTVVLPTASLANLAAITQTKAVVNNSSDEEAEETYDDARTSSDEKVGEGRATAIANRYSSENAPFHDTSVFPEESTSAEKSTQNEEKIVNYSKNDDMIPNPAIFDADGHGLALDAFISSEQEALPPLQEDEPDHSISVTSLATHLSRVGRGDITTAAELVAAIPNLADTAIVTALYGTGLAKSTRSLRTRLAGVEV